MSPHEKDFAQLLEEIKHVLDSHVNLHRGKISGFDDDDIRQELIIELWYKLPKVPKDITKVDYRFTRYIGAIFNRKIIGLHRAMLVARRPGEYRDVLVKAELVPDVGHIESRLY